MLVFKKIYYKNFLSTGNKPIEISLNNDKITVISGKNGNGKSSIIEAIFFAIYGKSFRKVNKDSLINSINKKNLLVILDFEINGINYSIKRGIKPNVFEIYVNDILKPQTANIKDYQKWLQSTVLHMDEKTFKQVVTMGSSSFVPFMRLNASERRTVIEDLLNIDIISQMSMIAKTRAAKLKDEYSNVEMNITSNNSILNGLKQAAFTIKNNINESIERINKELQCIKQESESIIQEITILKNNSNKKRYEYLTCEQEKIKKLILEGTQLLYKKQHSLKQINEYIDFFTNNSDCPYCTQKISNELISEKKIELNTKLDNETKIINDINEMINKLNKQNDAIQKEKDELYNVENQISIKYEEIEKLKQKLLFFMNEKENYNKKITLESKNSDSTIQDIENKITELQHKLESINKKLSSYNIIFNLLKDDGIKTVIIKNYLGIINTLIKKYLNIIGYNVSFSFDANFNETIKSRGRDTFEYNCFSEGERLRIDFCLLFTFRELAKLRATVNTNLLIIDEQDGRLDSEGVSSINNLLSSMNGNLIIISQYSDIYDDIATRHIIMDKEQHFTTARVL